MVSSVPTVPDPVAVVADGNWQPPRWLAGFALDLRSLALFRILIGACLVAALLVRVPQITAFYTDKGIAPRDLVIRLTASAPSVHLLSGSPVVQAGLFLLAFALASAIIVGYRTRLATIASWFLFMSLQTRTPMASHGGDNILRMMLFWGMFLPLNGRWSLDAGRDRTLPTTHLSPAGVGLVLQLCAVYWFAFSEKMDPIWMSERSAVYYALNVDLYATAFGVALRDHAVITRLFTVGTMALEFIGPLLAISPIASAPLRLVAVLSFIGFHAGLGLTMRLGTFPWICIAAWVGLLPALFWDRWAPALERFADRWTPSRRVGSPPHPVGPIGQAIAVLALLIITLGFLSPPSRPFLLAHANPAQRLLNQTGMLQRWGMFAPHPSTEDGWYVMEGVTRTGRRVDVWNGGTPSEARPADFGDSYRNQQWLVYLFMLRSANAEPYREHFGRYLCHDWNTGQEERIDSVSVAFMTERVQPPGLPGGPAQKRMILQEQCPT